MPLQLLDAALAAITLPWLGVPVFREGVLLHLPSITLEVAGLCSGIQSLLAFLPLALIYASYTNTRCRWVLYLVTVPIAVGANVVRIILTAAMTHYLGEWALWSGVHTLSGTFNFLSAVLALVLTGRILERSFPAGLRQSS
jgi:exosortase